MVFINIQKQLITEDVTCNIETKEVKCSELLRELKMCNFLISVIEFMVKFIHGVNLS